MGIKGILIPKQEFFNLLISNLKMSYGGIVDVDDANGFNISEVNYDYSRQCYVIIVKHDKYLPRSSEYEGIDLTTIKELKTMSYKEFADGR